MNGKRSSLVTEQGGDIRPRSRKRKLGLTTLLLACLPLHGLSFSPHVHSYRSKRPLWSSQRHDEAPSTESASSFPNNFNRRQAFTIATMALLGTATSARASPLENLALGTGQWTTSRGNASSGRVSPSFCTYLARFLINYDEGVSRWWRTQENTVSLLPPSQQKARLSSKFASLSKTVELAVDSFIGDSDPKDQYAKLLSLFIDKYGADIEAKRQVAILFSILPNSDQPVSTLRQLATKSDRKLSIIEPMNPAILAEDLAALIPYGYRCVEVGGAFRIEPSISFYEVGIGEDGAKTATATAFGPFSESPLTRDKPSYSADTYALFGISGAAGCALTHGIVIPLDVVKTKRQTDSEGEGNLFLSAKRIVEKDGFPGLYLGAQATLAGYFWYGLSVYPSYTFFKRLISLDTLTPEVAAAHVNDVALVAGALASVIASLGLTPIEAARIRAVANPQTYRPLGLIGTLRVIGSEGGKGLKAFDSLYAGLPSLLTRQVVFGSVKFLAFERSCDAIFNIWPFLRDETRTVLLVSLLAGAISGALSSVVSQPADSVLTYVSREKKADQGMVILEGVTKMIDEEGPGSLFRGLGSRCVWASSIIAGQFLLYDVFRSFFGVTSDDLSQVFEVVLPTVN